MTNYKQAEQLIILMEECAEVSQAASKILRFGDKADAIERLTAEIGDLLGIIDWVATEFKMDPEELVALGKAKQDKMLRWTSYQQP